ncbi:MAG: LamG-like jellyroll fold domain-containing protein [Luteolibacter sp.]|nr:LamG-like jellyroll fold domain-containing protein [Luteolibacter sp.]
MDTVTYNQSTIKFNDQAFLNTSFHANNTSDGARIHIMSGEGWQMRSLSAFVPTVTSTSGATITTNDTLTTYSGTTKQNIIRPGNEYYLTGKKAYLGHNTWFREGNRLFYKNAANPTAGPANVEYKARKYGFNVSGRQGITIQNLEFFACTIQTNSSSTGLTLNGLKMKYLEHKNTKNWNTYGLTLYDNSVLRNSELSFASYGILYLSGTNIKVINNFIHDSGYYPHGIPMVHAGKGNLISHNTLTDSGHALLGADGGGCLIQYNKLVNGMRLCTDGGLFYTANSAGGNSTFRYNIVGESPGPTGHYGSGLRGFYLDNLNNGWTVHHNVIWKINSQGKNDDGTAADTGKAFHFNSPTNFNMVFNNTTWDCNAGSLISNFWGDGPTGSKFFNNFFHAYPSGIITNWDSVDLSYRYNLFNAVASDFMNAANGDFRPNSSKVTDKGTKIPGVTDTAPSNTSTPDIGSLESGGTYWQASVGHNFTTPPAEPTFPVLLPEMKYANQVVNPSFESGTFANWTKTPANANVGLIKGPLGAGADGAWDDKHLRTGLYGLQFGGGTSKVGQTVSGLVENTRYVFHCGVAKIDSNATVNLIVASSGYPERVLTVVPSGSNTSTGLFSQNLPGESRTMYALPFATAPGQTQATVCVQVTRPGTPSVVLTPTTTGPAAPALADLSALNSQNINTAYANVTGVYVDDLSVTLDEGNSDPLPYPMPYVNYTFNQTSGQALDSTTLGQNATLFGTAAFRTGQAGHGNAFAPASVGNGSGYATAPAVLVPAVAAGSFTVAFWLKVNNSNNNYTKVACNNAATSNNKGWMVELAPNLNLAMYARSSTGGPQSAFSWGTLVVGEWTHVAYTVNRDAKKISAYKNGVYAKDWEIPISMNDLLTTTGLRFGSGTADWEIDDFQAWNSALSPREIKAASTLDPYLALQYKFNETTGLKAWDATGRGNNGTLSGTSTNWISDSSLKLTGNGNVTAPAAFTMPFENTDSYTIAFWLKINSSTGFPWIMHKSDVSNGWKIIIANGIQGTMPNQYYKVAFLKKDDSVGAYCNVPAGKFAHLAITVNRGTGQLTAYVDGVQNDNRGITGSLTSSNPLKLITTANADWQIDDLRIYTKALEWHDVQQLRFQIEAPPYPEF